MAPRRLLIVFNPAAGRAPERRLAALTAALERRGCDIEIRRTSARGDAEAIARDADAGRFDAVVAAGGDGTVNEVVNGLAGSDLPLGILPLGTGNVLANEIALPRRARDLAEVLATAPARAAWAGEIVAADGTVRRFVMMAGVGFDAAVVAALDDRLKQRVGKLAFVLAILGELWRYRPITCRVSCEGRAHVAASAIVCNGRFYGGRFVLAPAARIDDRSLHLVLFKRPGRLAALKYLAAMALGIVHRLDDVEIRRVATLEADAPAGAPVEGDGDIVARVPVTIRIAERPLQLIRPQGALRRP